MKKTSLFFIALVSLLYSNSIEAQSADLPKSLIGNWFKTDGSNEFVLGLSNENISYQANNWDISSFSNNSGQYEFSIRNNGLVSVLNISLKDSNTILLSNGSKEELLRKVRTYNYRHKQEQKNFPAEYFTAGKATVKGFIHLSPAKKSGLKNGYIEISYPNQLTGEIEYFQESIDKAGRFEISFPVYKPQLCTINHGGSNLANFFIQPGKTLFIAINPDIKINEKNPDYSSVMQRICMMGDDWAFNNDYQHFLSYSASFGFPEFKFPFETIKGKSVAEKKQMQIQYYSDLYEKTKIAIDHVYPSSKTNQQFRNFIQEEIKYNAAYALLSNLQDQYGEQTYQQYRVDSADLAMVGKIFFGQQQPTALLHDAFYKLMGYYVDKLDYAITRGSYTTSFSVAKMDARVKNDYGILLSGNFAEIYEAIKNDRESIPQMNADEILLKYFNGDLQAEAEYKFILRTISNEFFKESRDSTRYSSNRKLFKDPYEYLAANIWQLVHSNRSDEDVPVQSVYRLDLFKSFSKTDNSIVHLVDSLNRDEAIDLALTGLNVRFNETLIKQVDNETEWQSVLKSYRGKIVVIWMFSHYYDKRHASKSLFELQKMEEMYQGKNVVFLKCIQQRERNDRVRQLLGYMKLMKDKNAFKDVFYVNRGISAGALMEEDINGNAGIYNEQGQVHHPVYYSRKYTDQKFEELSLAAELDSVLQGKGRYYEGYADLFLSNSPSGRYNSYSPMRRDGKFWTLADTSGVYSSYTTNEPEKPVYQTGDSVFTQMVFMEDSVYREQELILHRRAAVKSSNFLFNNDTYQKEYVKNNEGYKYRFDKDEKAILIYDSKGKLYRRLGVVMINSGLMVLELKQ